MVFNIFATHAQFERKMILERTQVGLKAAKARGKKGGRLKKSPDDKKVLMTKKMSKSQGISVREICNTLGISRVMCYRYLDV